MQICQSHWSKLREAIEIRGMTHLVSKDGFEATERLKKGKFEPLMGAHNELVVRAIELMGRELLEQDVCPVCEGIRLLPPWPSGSHYKTTESFFIDGSSDLMLEGAIKLGLVQAN